MALAGLGIRALRVSLPRARDLWSSYGEAANLVAMDARVLLFALGVALVSGMVFSLAPAVAESREEIRAALAAGCQEGSSGALRWRRGRPRWRSFPIPTQGAVLVISQMALALILLAGSGLMIRTLYRMRTADLGFDGENVLIGSFQLPRGKYENPRQDFYLPLLERVRGLPGVLSASYATSRPLTSLSLRTWAAIEGRESAPDDFSLLREIGIHIVETEFLRTLDIPLLRGRSFVASDRQGSPLVVLVNQTATERFWPQGTAVGRRLGLGMSPNDEYSWIEVVGVVGDARFQNVEEEIRPEAYFHYSQWPAGRLNLFVKTAGNPLDLVGALRREVRAVNPGVPLYDVRPVAELARTSRSHTRFLTQLLSLFAALALALSATGIYGVMAFTVAARTRELGIRMALGATRSVILRQVLGEALVLTAAGGALGLFGVAALSRFLESQLYGVGSADPIALGATVVGLGMVATLAGTVPALRAARTDSIQALRHE